MRIFHYVEIQNFKRLGGLRRIELENPSVLIGPNHSGKTAVLQAIAFWSLSLRLWLRKNQDSELVDFSPTNLETNNLREFNVTSAPEIWYRAKPFNGKKAVPLNIKLGVEVDGAIHDITMSYYMSEGIMFAGPDSENLHKIHILRKVAKIHVELLLPATGLSFDEPIYQSRRINHRLSEGLTAQVLRNLCFYCYTNDPETWKYIVDLIYRMFGVYLLDPKEDETGAIIVRYMEDDIKERLELVSLGSGALQYLSILLALLSHKGSVVLLDEPDAHLEILRQKQLYLILQDIAAKRGLQIIIATHSEVIMNQAAASHLTLMLHGKADYISSKANIRNTLRFFGGEHYARAKDRKYVLYVEGDTDIKCLNAFADHLGHEVFNRWDPRINYYCTCDPYFDRDLDSNMVCLEGGFGYRPEAHFAGLCATIKDLKGLSILDSDRRMVDQEDIGSSDDVLEPRRLRSTYWRRYEIENYFISPAVLTRYIADQHPHIDLDVVAELLAELTLEHVFQRKTADHLIYQKADIDTARILWDAKSSSVKLSEFARTFFQRLSEQTKTPLLLSKGNYHQLIAYTEPSHIDHEVRVKLDLLNQLFPDPLYDQMVS